MKVTLDMSAEEHRQLKTLAAFSGMTMKDFILSRALELDETEYLLKSPANAARLAEAVKSPSAARVGFNSIEELRRALGI